MDIKNACTANTLILHFPYITRQHFIPYTIIPNCTLNVYGGGMSSFRICPTEKPGVTRMEFDYYHTESGDKFEEYFKFVRQVAIEDFELCEKAQENLEKGIYTEGILNPVKETGVVCK